MSTFRNLLRSSLLVALALAPPVVLAQDEDDAPIPYPDEETAPPSGDAEVHELPRHDYEVSDTLYSRLDDPNTGVGAELLGGLLLLDSSRGAFAEPRFAWGARANWEFGRLLTDETLHEALFLDVAWAYGALSGGTNSVSVDSNYHYFSVAPAWELHVGGGTEYAFYGQLGGGVAYQFSGVHHDGQETTIAGLKPVLQYGIGFRGRPKLSGKGQGNLHLAFRVELTRFRRGYMDDTLVAASLGASF